MISARPRILIKVTFLKHFALEVWSVYNHWLIRSNICSSVFNSFLENQLVYNLNALEINKLDMVSLGSSFEQTW